MVDDLARLGMEVDSGDVKQASGDLDKFAKEGKKAEGVADRVEKSGKRMAVGMKAAATAVAAVVGAVAAMAGSARVIANFERSMSRVKAITRATSDELAQMRDLARELGGTTEFTGTQAADALTFLGMAGFEAKESMAALPPVLDLATASGLGLAETADTASNILSAFGIAATETARVTDALAAASTRSNTSVSQLGQAISTVGPVAAALGIELEDTAAAIGVLGDAGIQGERAGTGLRGVLSSLAGPTKQAREVLARYGLTISEISPQVHGLSAVMQTLRNANIETADAMTIFGREAASSALVLTRAGRRIGDFGDEIAAAEGEAKRAADTVRDDLVGDIDSLTSAIEGLVLSMGDAGLGAALRSVVQGATDVVRALGDVADEIGGLRRGITSFYDAAVDGAARWLANQTGITDEMQRQNAIRREWAKTSAETGFEVRNPGAQFFRPGLDLPFDATPEQLGGIGAGLPGSFARRMGPTGSMGQDVSSSLFEGGNLGIPPSGDLSGLLGGGDDGGGGGNKIEKARAALKDMRLESVDALDASRELARVLNEGYNLTEINAFVERQEMAGQIWEQMIQARKTLAALPEGERERAIADLANQAAETARLTQMFERELSIREQLAQAEAEMGQIARVNSAIRSGATSEEISNLRSLFSIETQLLELRREGFSDDQIARVRATLEAQRQMVVESDKLNQKLAQQEEIARRVDQEFISAFSSFVSGAQSAEDALKGLLNQLINIAANRAFQSIFEGTGEGNSPGGLFGSLLDSVLGSFGGGGGGATIDAGGPFGANLPAFDRGGTIKAGGLGIVGERGPELVSGPAQVTSRAETASLLRGGGGGRVEVVARVENGSIVQDVRRISGEVSVQVMRSGLDQFSRESLPGRVSEINDDPRRVG